MEDYLVIILTLVVAVIGIIRGKNKKNTPTVAESEEPKQSTDFWDLIMNDQEEVIAEPVSDFVETEPDVAEVKRTNVKPKHTFSAANEGQSDIKDEIIEKVRTNKKVMIDGEKFSLRKAVIYSEIMNRKYS